MLTKYPADSEFLIELLDDSDICKSAEIEVVEIKTIHDPKGKVILRVDFDWLKGENEMEKQNIYGKLQKIQTELKAPKIEKKMQSK